MPHPEQEHETVATTEAHGGAQEASPYGIMTPNPGLIVFTIFTFVLLLVILRKLAWKPMLELLDKREQSIKDALEKSGEAKAEAEKILTEQKDILAKARRDAHDLLERSRGDGERAKEATLAQAREQAEKVIADGKAAIEQEKKSAILEIRKVAVDLALGAAAKVVEVNTDDQRQRAKVTAYVEELSEQGSA